MISAVIFDIDETLVDHVRAMQAATLKLHAMWAPTVPVEEFSAAWRAAHAEQYPRFLKGEVSYAESVRVRVRQVLAPSATDEQADKIFGEYLTDYEQGWRLFDDVVPCLRQLSSVRLSVISNGRAEEQRKKLEVLGIAAHFEHVCISEDLGVPKPDARIFRHVCDQLRVDPSDAVYVGDQLEIDAFGARAAGLQAVWVNRRGEPGVDGVVAVSSLFQLPGVLPGVTGEQ